MRIPYVDLKQQYIKERKNLLKNHMLKIQKKNIIKNIKKNLNNAFFG